MYFYQILYKPHPAGLLQMARYRDANDRITISFNSMMGALEHHNWVSEKTDINIQEYYRGDGQGNIPRDADEQYYETGRGMLIRGVQGGPYEVILRPDQDVHRDVTIENIPALARANFESPNLDRPAPPPPQAGGKRRRRRNRRSKRRASSYRRHTRRH